jgi:hypothetical protein
MHNEIKTGLETHANNIRDIARLIDRGVLTGTTASNALLEERDMLRAYVNEVCNRLESQAAMIGSTYSRAAASPFWSAVNEVGD